MFCVIKSTLSIFLTQINKHLIPSPPPEQAPLSKTDFDK